MNLTTLRPGDLVAINPKIKKDRSYHQIHLYLRETFDKKIYSLPKNLVSAGDLSIVIKINGNDIFILTKDGLTGWISSASLSLVSQIDTIS